MKFQIKKQLLEYINHNLSMNIASTGEEIKSIKESRNSDTKSSAGDKFETGRAMAQMELEKNEASLARTLKIQKEFSLIDTQKEYENVEFGSLVITNQGNYFASFGFGKITLDAMNYYAISLASPIGQVLRLKKVGDTVIFQGREIIIEEIW